MKNSESPEQRFIGSSSRHLFIAMVGIIVCCYVFDIVFFGSWAPRHDSFLITAFWWLVFVTVGIGFRTMAIRIGIFLDHSRGQGTRASGAVLRAIQIGCFFICTLATISFFAVEPERRATANESVVITSDATASSIIEKKALVSAEITQLEKERDELIASAQATIDKILTDGEADDLEDQETVRILNAQKAAVLATYLAPIAQKRGELLALSDVGAGNSIAGDTAAASSSTWAIFDWQEKRTGLKAMDVTDIIMLIITLIIEVTATWGVGGFARRMTGFRHNIAQRAIDDRLTQAQQVAELEAGELRAKLTISDLMRKIRIDHEQDEAARRERDAQHELELEVQAIRSKAHKELVIKEAHKEAAELLGEPDPFFNRDAPENDGKSRGGESGDITKNNDKTDKAIPVSDGRAST